MQRTCLFLFSLVVLGLFASMQPSGSAEYQNLRREFQRPPDAARPWVYWFWLNGNITREGITADLEAMKRAGIGGVLIMEVDQGAPAGPADFAGAEWRELFKFVCSEASRLGLEVNMNNDAGWCGSGGPWITPELSMQKLVASEAFAVGPGRFDAPLPQPQIISGFYRDIAVLAFPMPPGEDVRMDKLAPKLTATAKDFDGARLLDRNPGTVVSLPLPERGKESWIQIEFREMFAARTMTLVTTGGRTCHGLLQVSDDGKRFRTVREFDTVRRLSELSISFPEVSSRFFRVQFTKADRRLTKIEVADLELNPLYRIDNVQGKAAYSTQEIAPLRAAFPNVPAEFTMGRKQIIDLTSKLTPEGRLVWDAPEGQWTILRIGHTSTGKDNHPAPLPGRGLECDKLSKKAAEAHFNGLMGKLIADSKPLAGKTLVATHIDSWEVGSQNWTPGFREEFQKRRGYDLLPFLPVITGRVIENLEVSERFLWDLRQTVSELLLENYTGHFRELAHRNGLRLSIEAYDAPTHNLHYQGQADEPMAEFWSWGPNFAWSCTEAASAAHVYGRKIVGAEAFTATDAEKWQSHPATIKAMGDWAFAEGINRFVFHRYALQPWKDRAPGMSMGPWGLHYERTQTWWNQSFAWHEYLARCQYLLREGQFVADICYVAPEGSPQRFHPPSYAGNMPFRPKHNYDACPPEVVLTQMSVKDGRVVLESGMSYRLLVLPQLDRMTPELLRKIRDLVAAGATVVGKPPSRSPSLANYPTCDKEVKKLVSELWGTRKSVSTVREHALGEGRVIWGGDLAVNEQTDADAARPLKSARWIWHKEGHPARAVPVGRRYFRRVINIESDRAISTALFAITADNAFELFINGRKAGGGFDFGQVYSFDVAPLLKLGENVVAVAADNGSTDPNPAALIGSLTIKFRAGSPVTIETDSSWESAIKAPVGWMTDPGQGEQWTAAMDVGPLGMAPWGYVDRPSRPRDLYPEVMATSAILERMGVPADFEADQKLHYTHRRIGDMDVYFVANPQTNWVTANCTFRVSGEAPELWDPMTGQMALPAVFTPASGRTSMPLVLEPAGSIFVVFRGTSAGLDPVLQVKRDGKLVGADAEPPSATVLRADGRLRLEASASGRYEITTAGGRTITTELKAPAAVEITGPWEVRFDAGLGAPERVMFDRLLSWSEHDDAGVKHFSGAATYVKTFTVSDALLSNDQRVHLDLGRVQVMARVRLNGRDLGVVWRTPYRMDVTGALKTGENHLEIAVVNLWINRMIGDEQLPEDSNRNPNGTLKEWPQWLNEGKPSPTGRFSFTSWRLWKKDSSLQESGLLGPVKLQPVASKIIQ